MSSFGRGVLLALALFAAAAAEAEPRRRALLVGINDYAAGHSASKATPVAGRKFPNLRGAVNDVALMKGVLTSVYQFADGEIVTLTDGKATREGILNAIDRTLVAGAQRGDVLLFYYSGHGSQVRNSRSDEPDGMDESIVPADVHRGVRDIRDKELLRRFTPLIERGVRLTIILDSCHSGSGVRGLPDGGLARVAPPDECDVKDDYRGPSLESSGALVLAASADADSAFEMRNSEDRLQGVFTWAWVRAVRDAVRDEPALETFHRAAARMGLERPAQVPVIAGSAEARLSPFLGTRRDRDSDRVVVGVRSVDENGLVRIRGGWANGVTERSVLRPVTDPPSQTRLEVIATDGMAGCTARIASGEGKDVQSGTLLELVAWSPPRDTPLRVWMPEGGEKAFASARKVAGETMSAGIRWLGDPTAEREPYRTLRWNGTAWDSSGGAATGPVFLQLPASRELIRLIGTQSSVDAVQDPRDADYILTGRLDCEGLVEYAWVRPSVDTRDLEQSRMPLRTDWHDGRNTAEAAAVLKNDLRQLQRIHLWQTLPSPPEGQFEYRLAMRRARDNTILSDGKLAADERYGFVLRAAPGPRKPVASRYVYVFMVDSYGKSVLFYPRNPEGTVENRFPYPDTTPDEIRLGSKTAVIPEAPFGRDTFFLLTTEEPLTDPWILEWAGVRTPEIDRTRTQLEDLLSWFLSGDRSVTLPVPPARWSIERLTVTSVAGTSPDRRPRRPLETPIREGGPP